MLKIKNKILKQRRSSWNPFLAPLPIRIWRKINRLKQHCLTFYFSGFFYGIPLAIDLQKKKKKINLKTKTNINIICHIINYTLHWIEQNLEVVPGSNCHPQVSHFGTEVEVLGSSSLCLLCLM